jgi:hypothetical protein
MLRTVSFDQMWLSQGVTPDGNYGKVKYNYDRVFNTETQQHMMFDGAMKPIVEGVM